MKINLYIDQLVLDGVDIESNQRDLLHISVTTELTRLLNSRNHKADFSRDHSLSRISTNNIQGDGNKPKELGQQIAQSVYGGISRE